MIRDGFDEWLIGGGLASEAMATDLLKGAMR
jgi:hypothetical protein